VKVLSNDIVLRPRFQLEIPERKDIVLEAFEKSQRSPFLVKRLDEHIFIKFNAEQNHFWSPQLHLEIEEIDTKNSKLFGVYSPNPTLWTLFMFLHFGVATVFVILGIWAYSSASLRRPYGIQLGLMAFTVVLWFVLYSFGRAGKYKGKPQMRELYGFMMETLSE
jgi:hypothetical protein